jgi:hypothetical protein
MSRTVSSGLPVWRVRLRYVKRDGVPARERLDVAQWLEAVLPASGAVAPVRSLPFTDGWQVTLHLAASSGPEAVAAAGDLVEVVVGDAARVLGHLVHTTVAPAPRSPQ